MSILDWKRVTVLCVGGAGQVGRAICKQLDERGVGTIVVHDLSHARAEEACARLTSDPARKGAASYVASGGDLFAPKGLGVWAFRSSDGRFDRVCVDVPQPAEDSPAVRADRLQCVLDHRLGAFSPQIVRQSLIWHLTRAYRPQVIVDTINTATVLGYGTDVILSGRHVADLAGKILDVLDDGSGQPLQLDDLEDRLADRIADPALTPLLGDLVRTSFRMTAFLDSAAMIRFVQCLHALFQGDEDTRIPEFERFVKVHTTGLGGMGFNIQYTHGDTGEPGLSTKLLGKVCATGSLTQLLLTLSHTPGCDVRVVVPATLIGYEEADDCIVRDTIQTWTPDGVDLRRGPLPLVDSSKMVPCDGSTSLSEALCGAEERVVDLEQPLEVPYLHSGENKPYAAEDIAAITALGQMGSITKEEVAQATLECTEGDSRYDVLTAVDAAILLPTQTAAVVRDRELKHCRASCRSAGGLHLPSVSLGNLGPTTAKYLYEIEIIRARYETVARVANDATEMDLTLRACSYVLDDPQGILLRRQALSLGIPIFLRKGPEQTGLLLGRRLLYPDPHDLAALGRPLDPHDPVVRKWLATGWIDLTGPRMRWWIDSFRRVHDALSESKAVTRSWFDPDEPFTAGLFLGYLHSVSGGQRKEYM